MLHGEFCACLKCRTERVETAQKLDRQLEKARQQAKKQQARQEKKDREERAREQARERIRAATALDFDNDPRLAEDRKAIEEFAKYSRRQQERILNGEDPEKELEERMPWPENYLGHIEYRFCSPIHDLVIRGCCRRTLPQRALWVEENQNWDSDF
jgi:ATPase subunit of ABC transporter with duplicated ATPase domains